MKRERSPSLARLPGLRSGRIDVCRRPQQERAAQQKRLRSRQPSFSSSYGTSVGAAAATARYQPTATPVTPTSTSTAPPVTLMQFADFFVDPSAVSASEAMGLAEEMAADFFSELSIMYDMLSDIKSPTAEGRAVDELMRRLHSLLRSGPVPAAASLSTQASNVRGIYNGLIRVFIFLYQRYYRAFVVLEVSELLAASWQRLLAFVMEYRILDDVFVRTVYNHVLQIVATS